MPEFEGGDVGACVDFVGGVHVAWRGAVGLGVLDLGGGVSIWGMGGFAVRGRILTSISRKFSGGPYISSKVCWRDSGIDCILRGDGGVGQPDRRAECYSRDQAVY